MDFFQRRGLTPAFLREVSLHQVGLLLETFRSLDPDPGVVRVHSDVAPEARGGFLALRAADAEGLFAALLERGVRTDYRADVLRLGPAPYLCDDQLVQAVEALGEIVRG
jgi:kynureninase